MERKKIEALSAMTWDDPIAVDWGDSAAAEVVEEEPMATSPQQPDVNVTSDDRQQSYDGTEVAGIKCVAIYTYQVCTYINKQTINQILISSTQCIISCHVIGCQSG